LELPVAVKLGMVELVFSDRDAGRAGDYECDFDGMVYDWRHYRYSEAVPGFGNPDRR